MTTTMEDDDKGGDRTTRHRGTIHTRKAIKARADDPIVVVSHRVVVRIIVVVACPTRQHRQRASTVVHCGSSAPPSSLRLHSSGETTSPGKGGNTPPRSTTPKGGIAHRRCASVGRRWLRRRLWRAIVDGHCRRASIIVVRRRPMVLGVPRPDQRPSFHGMPNCRHASTRLSRERKF